MQSAKTIFMVSAFSAGDIVTVVRDLSFLRLGAGMQAGFVRLNYIYAHHPPGSLEGHKHKKKEKHDLFHLACDYTVYPSVDMTVKSLYKGKYDHQNSRG